MIAIIDYDAGNIKSVEKAFQFLGEKTVLSRDRDIILSAAGPTEWYCRVSVLLERQCSS